MKMLKRFLAFTLSLMLVFSGIPLESLSATSVPGDILLQHQTTQGTFGGNGSYTYFQMTGGLILGCSGDLQDPLTGPPPWSTLNISSVTVLADDVTNFDYWFYGIDVASGKLDFNGTSMPFSKATSMRYTYAKSNLTSGYIGPNVTDTTGAFQNCTSLTSVMCRANPTTYTDMFKGAGTNSSKVTLNYEGNCTEAKAKLLAATGTNVVVPASTTLDVTATAYSGTYDGKAHGITVSCATSGATITYSTSSSGTYSSTNPTYTAPGTYTVYYKVEKSGYTTVTGSKTVTINKASNTLTLASTSGSTAYGTNKTVKISTNTSGGTLSASSSNSSVATASISGSTLTIKPVDVGTAKITVTSAATTNYKSATATYTITVTGSTPTYTANNYTGTYDGAAHGITVTCSGATITYATSSTGTYSSTKPTYTAAGTYTTYYKIKKTGCTEVSGSATVTINKAAGAVGLSATSGTITYPNTGTFTISSNKSGGALSVKSSNTAVATVSISGNTVTITPGTTAGTTAITVTSAANSNYNAASTTYNVTVKNGTLSVTASDYTGTYDGAAHSISVACSGATITYAASSTGTYSSTKPTYTTAGTYTTYYKVAKAGYTTVSGSKTVTINKAAGGVTLSATSGTLTYPTAGTFTVKTNTSGGTLSVASSNNSVATASISDGKVTVTPGTTAGTATITVTSAATTNYASATATYAVTVKNGSLSVTANNYSGTYDGAAHGITVTCSGATITYCDTQNGNYTSTKPTYTNVGTYTTYYKVVKAGYATVTGNKTVTITKAAGEVKLSSTSGTLTYPTAGTFTISSNKSNGNLSVKSSNTDIVTATISGSKVTLTPGTTAGTATITVTSEATSNYNAATTTYAATVKNGTLSVTAKDYTGTYDGTAHGVTVTCSGATIKYGTTSGTYNLTANPTYTNAGVYTVYYQVSKTGYSTVTGSKTVTINKATGTGSVTLEDWAYGETAANPVATSSIYNPNDISISYATKGSDSYTATKPTTPGTYVVKCIFNATTNYSALTVTDEFTISKGTLNVSKQNYTGTYDGNAHTATVGCAGATITYGLTEGTYDLTAIPSFKDAGKYTVYFKAVKNYYNDATGSVTVEIGKANGSVVLSATEGKVVYPEEGSFEIKSNLGGALSVKSSSDNIAVATLKGSTVTITSGALAGEAVITVTSAATNNYKEATATYKVTVENGTPAVNVVNYSGIYDAKEHTVVVTSEGATITYSATEDGEYTEKAPSYVDAGDYTVYYKVVRPGYKTVVDTAKVTISKAPVKVVASDVTPEVICGTDVEFEVSEVPEGSTITATTSDAERATAEVEGNKVIVNFLDNPGKVTVTATSSETNNYASSSVTKTFTSSNVAPEITKEPEDVEVVPNTEVSFSIDATGTNCTYQWYMSSDRISDGVKLNSATKSTYTIAAKNVTTELSNKYFYCVVSNKGNDSITSDRAKLSVVTKPTAPVFATTVNSNSWSNKSIEIELAGSTIIGGTENVAYRYSLDSGVNWIDYTKAFTWDTDTKGSTIIARAYNTLYPESVSSDSKFIIKYDATAPVINSVTVEDDVVTIDATDETSGIAGYSLTPEITTFAITNNEEWVEDNIVGCSYGVYTLRVMDVAGNVQTYSEPVVVLNENLLDEITATSVTVTYDGKEHAPIVECEDALIFYGLEEGNCELEEVPTFVNAGVYTVYFEVYKENYESIAGEVTVTIDKAEKPANTPPANISLANSVTELTNDSLSSYSGWEWKADSLNKSLEAGQSYAVVAIYKGADAVNYATTETNVTVKRLSCVHPENFIETVEGKEPTCKADGYTESTICTNCEEVLTAAKVIKATGHTECEAVRENVVESTCSKEGSYDSVIYCETCKEVVSKTTEIIETLDHVEADEVIENVTAAACGEPGSYDSVVYCKDCHFEISRDTITTDAVDHIPAEAITENVVKADCTHDGSHEVVIYCKDCSHEISREQVVDTATGHTPAEEVTENVVEAACGKQGSYDKVIYCSTCEEEISREPVVVDALEHVAGDVVVENEIKATCEVDGSYENVIYCTVCSGEMSRETVTIEALGHTPGEATVENNVHAECEIEGGYDTVTYCTTCYTELNREHTTVPALEHVWGKGIVTTAPTVESEGVRTFTCDNCSATRTEVVPKLEEGAEPCVHPEETLEVFEGKPATCTKDGYTAYSVCGVCETYVVPKEVIPAKGHVDVVHEAKAPTCTETGYNAYTTCENCDEFLVAKEVLPATGHTEVEHEAKAPTCTENGHTAYTTCEICEEQLVVKEVVTALGHDWNDGVVTKEPTFSDTGIKTYTCNTCKETKTEVLNKVICSHTHTKEVAGKPATCTTEGSTSYKVCSDCNARLTDSTTIAKLNHTYDAGVVTKQPTTEAEGVKTYTCTGCKLTKTESIAKLIAETKVTKPAKAKMKAVKSTSKKAAKVTWKKVSKASGYQIQYSTSSKFKKAKSVTVKGNKSTSKTIKKLKSKKKYYVRVRAYKTVNGKKVYGSWSAKKTVKVK